MTKFTLSKNLNTGELLITGHLTVWEDKQPIKEFRIEAKTHEEFENIARLLKTSYLELQSDESN